MEDTELFLKSAADRADRDPERLTVRNLLALFGAKARGAQVIKRVAAELAGHGLKTDPDFVVQHFDAEVSLVSNASGAIDPTHENFDDRVVRVFTIGAASRGVLAVKPTDTIEQARTLMALNDFSQLAVGSTPRSIDGAISWESIGRAELCGPIMSVREAIDPAEKVELTDNLLPLLSRIADAGFVLVTARDRTLSGIITASDVTIEFGALAEPFFLIGELENRLRRVVANAFSNEELTTVLDPEGENEIETVDDLSFAQLVRVIQPEGNWARLEWPLDRRIFLQEMDEVRQMRNSLVHFRGDLPSVDEVGRMRRLLCLVRILDHD